MVTDNFTPVMGCEEFALFQEQIPGLFLYKMIWKDTI